MSISGTVSDLTGKIQSAGVEQQPGVEHFRCKARRPLLPPTTSIWRPELRSCRWCNRAGRRGSSMPGFYPAVAKLRAYLLRPLGSAAREKACWRWWQIPSRFARTERARDEGRERGSSWLVQAGARYFAANEIYVRDHANLTDNTIRRVPDCTIPRNTTR